MFNALIFFVMLIQLFGLLLYLLLEIEKKRENDAFQIFHLVAFSN